MSKLIIREQFATVPNELLNDNRISLKAKGLFGFLQGKPNEWKFSTERIASQLLESEKVIRKTLQELEQFGLLERILKPKDNKGKWTGYDYILYSKVDRLLPNPSFPKATGRFSDRMDNGEDISKQEYSKQEVVNTIISSDKSQEQESDNINLVFKEFYELGNRGINFGNKTERKAVSWLLKEYGFKKTINTIKYAMSVQGKKYAPSITTPYQLKTNLVKLMAYYKREQEPTKGSVPIFKL